MKLRKGKTKTTLQAALDAALLAVEVYNKPRTTFRSEAYIALMIIAWTRMFHAHFNATIGDKYYYKKKGSNRYVRVDGERKAWELATCIKKHGTLEEPVQRNLEFFIRLRNKIEHRHIARREVDVLIFGECQALLNNFENAVVEFFGKEYALNESLVYSLQLSHLRTGQQRAAGKEALSKDLLDVVGYVEKYRSALPDDVFASQEYSIKLLQIPKIANTNRADLAVEFVRWDELSDEDKKAYEKITALVKDRKIAVEAANVGRLKPGEVVASVREALPGTRFSLYTHTCLYKLLEVRPAGNAEDPFETNPDYCHYDEAHEDYVFQSSWPRLIVEILQSGRASVESIHEASRNGDRWDLAAYES